MRWLYVLALALAVALPIGAGGCVSFDSKPAPDAAVDELGTLRNGCVVMLHMDEPEWVGAAREVADACGGDDPGTLTGSATTVANGAHGRAGSFAGAGCVQIADRPELHATTALTLSAWILPTAQNGIDAFGVISKRIDITEMSAYSMYIWQRDHVWVDLEGMDDRFEGRTAIADNVWTQVTLVFDGAQPAATRVRVYLNATLDITGPETAPVLSPFTAPLSVGCLPSVQGNQNFIGQLDEVAVWTRVLTDGEINQWYLLTRPGG